MLYTLKNEFLTVTVSDLGAELVSVKGTDNCEYIWQGSNEFWAGKAPILFPICGRLVEGRYTYGGSSYNMNIHGFARNTVFQSVEQGDSTLRMTLVSTEESKAIYPFDFSLTVDYRLAGNRLESSITIKNTGDKVLPAALGLHPGFNVPFDTGCFEDWKMVFGKECSPDLFLLSETCFVTGKKEAFPLVDGKILPMRHNLFDNDAIFLSNTDRVITLCSDKSDRSVTFEFPDFPYVGFWHNPHTEAPFVCIEPWCGLPSYDGIVDDFSKKNDMFRLLPEREKTSSYALIFQ